MAIKVKLNKPQTLPQTPDQPYTKEAVELMRAVQVREQHKGGKVSRPAEVFAVLLGMGYKRGDRKDIQSRASEFVTQVRQLLVAKNRRSPSYDEVLSVMSYLGYTRALVS